MKIYVITWAYSDGDKSGAIAAFKDEATAEEFLEQMRNHGDSSKTFTLVETILL